MLTDKKDLRGGSSVWSDSPRGTVRTKTILSQETCDVVIVGGGVSGALAACLIARAGHDVIVVDRRQPGFGSTVASTAMIQFEIDQPLTKLIDQIGSKAAQRAYLRSFKAVASLKQLIADFDINAAWHDRDALYLTGSELGRRGMQSEAEARSSIGLPSRFLTGPELNQRFGIERTGAILSQGAAELDPIQLTAGCLRAAQRHGCRIYSQQEIISVEHAAKQVVLQTKDGGSIAAKRVIFTTGYETVDGLPKGGFDITSSWAIATKPIPAADFWPSRCLIWEAADPYLYVRATADNRVIAGGEDSGLTDPDRRDSAIAAKSAKLLKALNELLPGRTFEIEYAWAGAFAESPTGLPIIGPLDGHPNCMAILGCGGNGITFSTVAAEVALSWVQDKRDPDLDLFAP